MYFVTIKGKAWGDFRRPLKMKDRLAIVVWWDDLFLFINAGMVLPWVFKV